MLLEPSLTFSDKVAVVICFAIVWWFVKRLSGNRHD